MCLHTGAGVMDRDLILDFGPPTRPGPLFYYLVPPIHPISAYGWAHFGRPDNNAIYPNSCPCRDCTVVRALGYGGD